MVEFIHGVVALLAGLILVLTALVGWLYLQQSRMSHAINALAVAVTAPPPSFMYTSLDEQAASPPAVLPEAHVEDDRLSVHDVQEDLDVPAPSEHIVESASADDDVSGKTVSQLRDMLTAKGIPFNKSDKKSTLVSLVQVSA
jgi:hypothetical protein